MNNIASKCIKPDHVPDELVREIDPQLLPGQEDRPIDAASALHDGPDIFWSPIARLGQAGWVVTRYELMREILQDPGRFSSKHIAGFSLLLGEEWDLIPLEKDPPEHARYRMAMNPLFAPNKINEITDSVMGVAQELVDGILERGECEFIEEFSRPFPVLVILSLIGLPLDELDRFLAWEDGLLRGESIEKRAAAAMQIKEYLLQVVADRRENPQDDLITFTTTCEIDGELLTEEEVLGVVYLLFVGGLDTVASVLGFMFRHLAENPDQQQQLRDDPSMIPQAIEELLRAFPVVTTARVVTQDMEFHGVQFKQGERVILSTPLAGRDSQEFECPHKVDFERDSNRHITFSSGPHRCVGSHLARRELKIALELWLSRIPPFRVKDGKTPIAHGAGVAGVDYLPLTWS